MCVRSSARRPSGEDLNDSRTSTYTAFRRDQDRAHNQHCRRIRESPLRRGEENGNGRAEERNYRLLTLASERQQSDKLEAATMHRLFKMARKGLQSAKQRHRSDGDG